MGMFLCRNVFSGGGAFGILLGKACGCYMYREAFAALLKVLFDHLLFVFFCVEDLVV